MARRWKKAAQSKKRQEEREAVARWRYAQIVEALPSILTRRARAQIVREMGCTPVVWPNGDLKPILRSTAHRWIQRSNEGGLEALRPRRA